MKILILGAGKMGSFFTDVLSFDHECAVYEIEPRRMRFLYNTQRFTSMDEIEAFCPDLVINCVTLKYTLQVVDEVIPKKFGHLKSEVLVKETWLCMNSKEHEPRKENKSCSNFIPAYIIRIDYNLNEKEN